MAHGLGSLIQSRRRELGLSQQELARRVGIPTTNLSSLEHTVSRWQSRLIVALSNELQIPQIELALAAGMITDLPLLGAGDEIDDLHGLFVGNESASYGEAIDEVRQRITQRLTELPADKIRLLDALIGQLTERAAQGQPAGTR